MQVQEFDPDVKDVYFSMMSCVEQCCIDLDIPSAQYANRLLSWGMRSLVELKLDASNEVKTVKLPIDDVCVVQLPSDFVDWSKVGVQCGQYIKTLSVNESLDASPRTLENWNPSERFPPGDLPNGVGFGSYSGWAFGNYGGRALFAFGGGLPHRGHYKITNNNGCQQLLLDAGIDATEIYLEYIGLGVSICGSTILHPYYYEYVRASIHYEWARFGKRIDKSEAEIQRLGRDKWHQEMKVRGRINSISPTDLLTVSRRNYRLTNHS